MQVLRDNKIGREGAVAVCDLMLQNRCITKLDLSGQKKTATTSEWCWVTLLMMVRWRRGRSEEVREHNDDNGTTN